MAVTDISSYIAERNPGKAKHDVAKAMEDLDESILMLGLARDSISLHEENSPALEAIHLIHRRLRQSCETLLKLL